MNGAKFRPSHIHVKVYVDGVERLTSQLYFAGDPYIPDDPWASVAPERAVALTESGVGEVSGVVDIIID